MLSLFSVLVVFQGKVIFTNMSRYSPMNEKWFQRWSHRVFDFCECNMKLIELIVPEQEERIAAIDTSFMSEIKVSMVYEQYSHSRSGS